MAKQASDAQGLAAEKLKALQTTLEKLDKAYGKGTVMRLSDSKVMDVPVISTGSLGLDLALGIGGVPRGRVVEIYGPESSGKTTLTLHMIAEAQKAGGLAAFVDAEHAFEQAFQDIEAHMQLSVARIQTLIEQVQGGLDPAVIEDEINRQGGLSLSLELARKARLWDLYCERYRQLAAKWN